MRFQSRAVASATFADGARPRLSRARIPRPPEVGTAAKATRRAASSPFFAAWTASLLLAALALQACGSTDPEYVERPVEELYNEALDALDERDYGTAVSGFEETERQHPYSRWATRAQLMIGYAHYLSNDYDQAVVALDRYIRLHPGNRRILAYAYYLRALSFYERISDVVRDQSMTEEALRTLDQVVRRFPDTPYARDAGLRIDLARNHLAGKEMEVGRFYLRRGHYVAAINRFRRVVDEHQTTDHVPEALHRLVEAFVALGIMDEATRTAAVLGHNFPGSEWYLDSHALVAGAVSGRDERKR